MKKQLPAWLMLGIVTTAAGLLLGFANDKTKDRIAEQAQLAADAARQSVLQEAEVFEQQTLEEGAPVDNLYFGKKGEEIVGYVAQVSTRGYGGIIEVVTGVNPDGVVTGISVGGSRFSETAGLGARSKEPWFMEQFRDKSAPVSLGTDVQAISGASITSGAVTSAVNKAADYILSLLKPAGGDGMDGPFGKLLPGGTTKQEEAAAPNTDAVFSSDAGAVVYATQEGYHGPVQVQVGFYHNGAIAGLDFNRETFEETPGFGANALEDSYLAQFPGKTAPFAWGEGLDSVSGASFTSQALITALNNAYEAAKPYLDPAKYVPFEGGSGGDSDALLPGNPELTEGTPDDTIVAVWTAENGMVVESTGEGYHSAFHVKVGILSDGTIHKVQIVEETFEETPGFGMQALEDPSYLPQFTGKSGAVAYGDGLDALSSASFTSAAMLEAVNKALAFAAK